MTALALVLLSWVLLAVVVVACTGVLFEGRRRWEQRARAAAAESASAAAPLAPVHHLPLAG